MTMLQSITRKVIFQLAAVTIAVTFIGDRSFAATEDGSFASRGLGARSCSEIIALIQGEQQAEVASQLSSWVAGYLSHMNRVTSDVFDVMPIQDTMAVATLVARICEQNPESLMEPAMATLVATLASGAQTEPSEMTTVTHEGRSTVISQTVMQQVQERFIALEQLPAGSADGLYGPQTRAALISFQQENNLEETGLPDPLTLFVFFNSQ